MKLTEQTPNGFIKTDLEPTKILCVARNYREHAEEIHGPIPEEPLLFLKPPSCLIESGDTILLPKATRLIHHEIEFAIIIGRRARHISVDEWENYVYGYAVFRDITARDLQENAKKRGEPWTVSKGFDTFGPISAVTSKERISDPQKLEISLKKNGTVQQKSNTGRMIFKIPHILEYASRVMTLERGDIISTGTPEGVGEIRDGDQLEGMIDGLGTLKVSARRV